MKRVLMVCTGNTCRSPMAEGIFKKLAEERGLVGLSVQSRGLAAYDGDGPSSDAVEALEEIGADLCGHRARQVQPDDLLEADRIYVMTEQHKNVIVESLPETAERITVVGIPDPFGQPLAQYRICRDELLAFFSEELKRGDYDR